MALSGADVYARIIKGETTYDCGLVSDAKPAIKTSTLQRIGIGNMKKSRINAHDYECSWSADVSDGILLAALLNKDNVFDVQLHDIALTDAVVKSLRLAFDERNPLTYSIDFVGKDIEEITALAAVDYVKGFFVMSDATITFSGSANTVTKVDINAQREVEIIRGASLDPQDFSKGPFVFEGTVTVSPSSSFSDVLKGKWLPTDTPFTFSAVFSAQFYDESGDPLASQTTITIACSGMVASETSVSLGATGPVEIPIKMSIENVILS
jgi:hypothetical protein